jgi:hypothetical protein
VFIMPRMTRPIMFTRVSTPVTPTIPGHHLIISTWDTTHTPVMRITQAILTGSAMVTRHGTIHLVITATIRRCMPAITIILTIQPGALTTVIAHTMMAVVAGKTTTVMMMKNAWLEMAKIPDEDLLTVI